MEPIKCPLRGTISETQRLAEVSIEQCAKFEFLSPYVLVAQTKLNELEAKVQSEKVKSENKAFDYTRDEYTCCLFDVSDIDAKYVKYPADVLAEIKKAQDILQKYGKKICAYSYADQSIATSNLTAELNNLDLVLLAETNIPRWLTMVEEANANFETAAKAYFEDSFHGQETEAAYILAKHVREALNSLYVKLFAYRNIEQNTELDEAENYVRNYIDTL